MNATTDRTQPTKRPNPDLTTPSPTISNPPTAPNSTPPPDHPKDPPTPTDPNSSTNALNPHPSSKHTLAAFPPGKLRSPLPVPESRR